jgi:prefoldin subunit 5
MTIDEKLEILHDSIKSLENIAGAHQTSIEAHDRQIGDLLTIAEKLSASAERRDAETAALKAALADLSRQLQAYFTRIPPQ